MGKQNTNSVLTIAQIAVWAAVFLLPAAVNVFVSGNMNHAWDVMRGSFFTMWPCLLIYLLNYLILAPQFLFRDGRKKWFWIFNLLLLIVLNRHFLHPTPIPPEVADHIPIPVAEMWGFYVVGALSSALFHSVFIVVAVGIRYIVRSHKMEVQLQEEKRKTAEAELTWLKHQLNPHFLFNTLNNISSLTQIDPDKAQESIGELSDTLRYALYDTDTDKVPLAGEVTFMINYIHLMQLRCNELTEVKTSFDVPADEIRIAPLLFISPIENAFKHGVNARMASFVHVGLFAEGKDLVFECKNTVFEHNGEDHIGSGIGVENLKRRLELIYPEAYTYEQQEKDGIYSVRIVIKNLIG
ncbi:MAG: histidine kinase [Bacteroidales bacterium]|nr:histidine kinase [Bacteroidales bacterium]